MEKRLQHAYAKWMKHTIQSRETETEKDYTRRLKVASIVNSRKLQEIQILLQLEKDKVHVEQARYNVLWRQLQEGNQHIASQDNHYISSRYV